MKEATIVVAYGNNFVIGKDNRLPSWKLPRDMRNFKDLTVDNIVLMGRKTFESFPEKYRPLPERFNIILSRQTPRYIASPRNTITFVIESFDKAHALCSMDHHVMSRKKVFIIGGAQTYKEALEMKSPWFVNEIIATEVRGDFEGDTYFPAPDYSLWKKELLFEQQKDDKNSHDFSVIRYSRNFQ